MIFNVMIPSGSAMYAAEAIEYGGRVLIVAEWLTNPSLGLKKPRYSIPLDTLAHQNLVGTDAPYHYVVNQPLPRSLFDGTATAPELAAFRLSPVLTPRSHFLARATKASVGLAAQQCLHTCGAWQPVRKWATTIAPTHNRKSEDDEMATGLLALKQSHRRNSICSVARANVITARAK